MTKNDITGDSIRSKISSDNSKYADGWTMIFDKPKSRKAQPKNSLSQIHKDRSKVIPRKYKYNNIDEE